LQNHQFHAVLRHYATGGEKLRLMVPEVVKSELKSLAKDSTRFLPRFTNVMISKERLHDALSPQALEQHVQAVLNEFSTWVAPSEFLQYSGDETNLEQFFIKQKEVFEILTETKALRGDTHRSEFGGDSFYPEPADLEIYKLAAHLANQPVPNIGAILVASMDGDFTLIDRAIEEEFGFGVVKSQRSLNPWLSA